MLIHLCLRSSRISCHYAEKLKKKGIKLQSVYIEGRTIAKTFWGKAWCDHLEAYSDFASRLPRGRTYVRNGSVIDLQVTKGQVKAQAMGSSLYQVKIDIKSIPEAEWKALVQACAGKIDSLIELLQGKFSKAVMEIMTQKEGGLFPMLKEISMNCSCPDYAGMCKHIAAVLYGIGAMLDVKPENLFILRHVDHMDLIAHASKSPALVQNQEADQLLEDDELSALFGIELDAGKTSPKPEPVKKKTRVSRKAKLTEEVKPLVKSVKTVCRMIAQTEKKVKTKPQSNC